MLCLDIYLNNLLSEGFSSIEQMTGITWEDLEDIGIHKLGRTCISSYCLSATNSVLSVWTFCRNYFTLSLLLGGRRSDDVQFVM